MLCVNRTGLKTKVHTFITSYISRFEDFKPWTGIYIYTFIGNITHVYTRCMYILYYIGDVPIFSVVHMNTNYNVKYWSIHKRWSSLTRILRVNNFLCVYYAIIIKVVAGIITLIRYDYVSKKKTRSILL